MISESVSVSDTPEALQVAVAARRRFPSLPESTALALVLVGLALFFSLASPFFLGYNNLVNIATNVAIVTIVAAPATLLLIGGQIDLSVGAGVAFVGVVMAWAAPQFGIPTAIVLALLSALLIGVINGVGVSMIGVNSLVTTLATLSIFRGMTKVLSNGQTLLLEGFSDIGTARPFLNIPVPVYAGIATVILFVVVTRYVVYGRSMYAIGSSPTAARLAGIRTTREIFVAFVVTSAFVGIAGLMQVSQLGAASATAATGLEISVVTAIILGGASLAGGRGTIHGTVLAVLIIGVLNNGLVLLNVPSFWQEVARGMLLFGAVAFDQLRSRLTSH
jgi:ribose transport system permease protein